MLKVEDVWVCRRCKWVWKRKGYERAPTKCPKCGGSLVRMVVLKK